MYQSPAQKAVTHIILHDLWQDGHPDRARLAALRSARNLNDHLAVNVWPVIFESLPESSLSKSGKPSPAELAVFTALHMYAIYQQSSYQRLLFANYYNQNCPGTRFFKALGNLRSDPKMTKSLDRRIQNVLVLQNIQVVINSLNHLISILKGTKKGQLIDFADLAGDLERYQSNYDSISGSHQVALKWGQEYFYTPINTKQK